MQRCAVRPVFLALLALGILGWPVSAHAWTTATVRTARARVTLSEDARRVHVELMAEVRVDGGWLEGFDFDGLDEGLELDPNAPPVFERWAVPEEEAPAAAPLEPTDAPPGEALDTAEAHVDAMPRAPIFVGTLSPRISVRGTRIGMSFPRRSAPRAGLYRAYVTYDAPADASLIREVERAEFQWTLPAWRYGLEGVEITVVLPEGSTLVALEEDEDASVDVVELDPSALAPPLVTPVPEGWVALAFTRIHLPRTQSWTVRAELPASFRAAAPPPPPELARPSEIEAAPPASPIAVSLIALVLAVLVVAKQKIREADEARAEVASGALLRMPSRVRAGLTMLLLWGAWGLSLFAPHHVPWVFAAIAVLGTYGSSRALPGARRLGSFRSAWGASPASVRAAQEAHRRARRARVIDATTWQGLVLLGALLSLSAFLAARGWLSLEVALVAAASFVLVLASGGGAQHPRDALASLGALLAWAETLTVSLSDGLALAPLVHVDIRGRVQAARLRVVLPHPEDGLVRSDLVLGTEGAPCLVLAARRGSKAERALLALAAKEGLSVISTPQDRTALAWNGFRLSTVAEAFDAQPESPSLARAS